MLVLAFAQAEHDLCDSLLGMAERGEVDLAVPAFSLAEAYHKQIWQQKERQRLHDLVLKEIEQLGRSRPYAERSRELREITGLLVASGEEERRALATVRDRLLAVATAVPITASVVREAATLENTRGLPTQDAHVYASVLAHLRDSADRGDGIFGSTNSCEIQQVGDTQYGTRLRHWQPRCSTGTSWLPACLIRSSKARKNRSSGRISCLPKVRHKTTVQVK